jgi:hypothetical protein
MILIQPLYGRGLTIGNAGLNKIAFDLSVAPARSFHPLKPGRHARYSRVLIYMNCSGVVKAPNRVVYGGFVIGPVWQCPKVLITHANYVNS